ncbi:MAG: ubiquinol-cytochrome c reductase iron-sulfur subunit [Chloroflexota bacterium]|nr:ubiquinol-cytochrome c reductase iron-sulfur subunit [Chloroflexota bacterium]
MAAEAKTPATSPQPLPPLTRREFLNYAWLTSLGFVFLVGFGGATYFFAFPRFKVGEFGGLFPLGKAGEALPKPTDPPIHNTDGKFWLSNVNGMIVALYDVCVHLGCLYQWQEVTGRFECPCHGSKYQKDGTYIEGPAPRSLDRMVVSFVGAGNQVVAATDSKGDPLPIPSDPSVDLVIDTGKVITGASHG